MKKVSLITLVLLFIIFSFTSASKGQNLKRRQLEIKPIEEDVPVLVCSEIYDNDEFTGRLIINYIYDGEKYHNIYRECSYENSNTTFDTYITPDNKKHNFKWRDNKSWKLDLGDINYKFKDGNGNSIKVTGIELGVATCSCGKKHLVYSFLTDQQYKNGNFNCIVYMGKFIEDWWV